MLAAAAVVGAVFLIGLPYDVAFKLVTVLGVLSLPVAAYAFGRLAGLPFPTPALFAIATLPFLFNREPTLSGTGNIIGGNLTSTLAGEFSFSLSLTFGVLFLGTIVAGFRTGRYRWLAAILLALTALCHVIVAIFVLIAAALAFVVWPGKARLVWLACVLPVGGLLTAFWTLPFFAAPRLRERHGLGEAAGRRRAPERLAPARSVHHQRRLVRHDERRLPHRGHQELPRARRAAVARRPRRRRPRRRRSCCASASGSGSALIAFTMALGFIVAPESRLWNARLLPFYYLALVPARCARHRRTGASGRGAGVARSRASERRARHRVKAGITAVALGIVVVMVGLPLKALPGETNDAAR